MKGATIKARNLQWVMYYYSGCLHKGLDESYRFPEELSKAWCEWGKGRREAARREQYPKECP